MNITHCRLTFAIVSLAILALLITIGVGNCRRVQEIHASAETAQQQLPGSYGTMLNTLNSMGGR